MKILDLWTIIEVIYTITCSQCLLLVCSLLCATPLWPIAHITAVI